MDIASEVVQEEEEAGRFVLRDVFIRSNIYSS
jgi:hypothetical protein